MEERHGDRLIVRPNPPDMLEEYGPLDEVIILEAPNSKKCLLHLEQMAEDHFWMQINGSALGLADNLVINFCVEEGRLRAHYYWG